MKPNSIKLVLFFNGQFALIHFSSLLVDPFAELTIGGGDGAAAGTILDLFEKTKILIPLVHFGNLRIDLSSLNDGYSPLKANLVQSFDLGLVESPTSHLLS